MSRKTSSDGLFGETWKPCTCRLVIWPVGVSSRSRESSTGAEIHARVSSEGDDPVTCLERAEATEKQRRRASVLYGEVSVCRQSRAGRRLPGLPGGRPQIG